MGGQSELGANSARRFCAANSQRSGEFPQGGFTPPEEVDPPRRGPRADAPCGEMDCPPPAAQEKAIAAAKAMAEEA